jgi:hypothetical protein
VIWLPIVPQNPLKTQRDLTYSNGWRKGGLSGEGVGVNVLWLPIIPQNLLKKNTTWFGLPIIQRLTKGGSMWFGFQLFPNILSKNHNVIWLTNYANGWRKGQLTKGGVRPIKRTPFL